MPFFWLIGSGMHLQDSEGIESEAVARDIVHTVGLCGLERVPL